MVDKIREQLRIDKIRKFKNPVVLMHETDFDVLKKHVESKFVNFKIGNDLKIEGFPIRIHSMVEKGNFIVYDDYLNIWL